MSLANSIQTTFLLVSYLFFNLAENIAKCPKETYEESTTERESEGGKWNSDENCTVKGKKGVQISVYNSNSASLTYVSRIKDFQRGVTHLCPETRTTPGTPVIYHYF